MQTILHVTPIWHSKNYRNIPTEPLRTLGKKQDTTLSGANALLKGWRNNAPARKRKKK